MEMIKQLKIALLLLILLTLLTGLVYPTVVTGLAQAFFPWQANGSLIEQNGKVVGSLLIGQSFTAADYFWGRPSATTPFPYNAASSSGSNLGPDNPDFIKLVQDRVTDIEKSNSEGGHAVPVDLITASGSGLDPDISPFAAFYQVPRIAKARHVPEQDVQALIRNLMKGRTFDVLGESRINVLQLNMALDNLK